METQFEISQENSLAVIERINELHAEAVSLSKSTKDYAEQAIYRAIECGRLLTEQKKIIEHGKWEKWCGSNLKFTERTARKYICLYKKLPVNGYSVNEDLEDMSNRNYGSVLTNPKTLRQAYIATGILPESEKLESEECSSAVVIHVKYIDNFLMWYKKTNRYKPAKEWNLIEVISLIQLLEPVARIYNELVEIQENS